jgi:xylulose-5-phosphate/fructose-6-phosphate phosphoketolase
MTASAHFPLTEADAEIIDRYWRAANHLAACQIYLMANPLLAEPLRPDHIKPRLLGHRGTSPA